MHSRPASASRRRGGHAGLPRAAASASRLAVPVATVELRLAALAERSVHPGSDGPAASVSRAQVLSECHREATASAWARPGQCQRAQATSTLRCLGGPPAAGATPPDSPEAARSRLSPDENRAPSRAPSPSHWCQCGWPRCVRSSHCGYLVRSAPAPSFMRRCECARAGPFCLGRLRRAMG